MTTILRFFSCRSGRSYFNVAALLFYSLSVWIDDSDSMWPFESQLITVPQPTCLQETLPVRMEDASQPMIQQSSVISVLYTLVRTSILNSSENWIDNEREPFITRPTFSVDAATQQFRSKSRIQFSLSDSSLTSVSTILDFSATTTHFFPNQTFESPNSNRNSALVSLCNRSSAPNVHLYINHSHKGKDSKYAGSDEENFHDSVDSYFSAAEYFKLDPAEELQYLHN